MKLKAIKKDNIIKLKFKILQKTIPSGLAKYYKIEPNYIKKIVIKVNDKVIYNITGSNGLSSQPIFKLKFKNADIGDKVTVTWYDLKGKSESKTVTIK